MANKNGSDVLRLYESRQDIIADLESIQDTTEFMDEEDVDGDDDSCRWIDVRLQAHGDGSYAVHSGDASYDQDHTGYWGAGSIGPDTDCASLAYELIEEANDDAAQSGEFKDEPDEEDVFTEDGRTFYYCRKLIATGRQELETWFDKNHFHPNVWRIEERGDCTLIQIEDAAE